MLFKDVFFRLFTLVKSYYVDSVTISTGKQMASIGELNLLAALEVNVDIWNLLQVSSENVHNPHFVQKAYNQVQSRGVESN